MSDPTTDPFDILIEQIRQVVREEIASAHHGGTWNSTDKDTLLSPEETAAIMGVTPRWLYRHAATLPFTRRISRKNLRFSEAGLRRWIAAKKPDFRR